MNLLKKKEPVPISEDKDGVIRVSGTRVTLDTIIEAFNEGLTAEEISYRFPALNLADVYAVISYYLRNTQVIENYLYNRNLESEQVKRENQTRFQQDGIRKRLLARKAYREKVKNAPIAC